jgi:hypothetical protein
MNDHSIPAPRTAFIRDAQTRLEQHYRDQARLAALEAVLADCLHYIATTYGMPSEAPEPECAIKAKQLLGWKLG